MMYQTGTLTSCVLLASATVVKNESSDEHVVGESSGASTSTPGAPFGTSKSKI